MNAKHEFQKIMASDGAMALATSVDYVPNVRIVNFIYDEDANRIFFTSFKKNEKVRELEINNRVAFTTIPMEGNKHVKGKGSVMKSHMTVYDKAEDFIKKLPDYAETIDQAGAFLVLYEIKVEQVRVTLDMANSENLTLEE